MDSTAPDRERAWRVARVLVVLAALAPRAYLAWTDQGLFWPDEVYQSLEPAHRIAFGYGNRAWEWRLGARSWLLPGIIAGFWKVLALVLNGPGLVRAAKLAAALLSALGVGWGMSLAGSIAGPEAGLLAGLLAGAFPPGLVLGHRVFSEMVTGPLFVLSALWLWRGGPRAALAAGVLAGSASFMRYQTAALAVGLGLIPVQRRQWKDLRQYVLGGAVAVLLWGVVLDGLAWGTPFHTAATYAEHNLKGWGKVTGHYVPTPWSYYWETAQAAVGPLRWVILLGALAAARRAWAPVLAAVLFFGLHCWIPYKEFRFVMPGAPLLLALAGVGLGELLKLVRLAQPATAGAVGLALAVPMAVLTPKLTFADLGQWPREPRGRLSVFGLIDDVDRTLWEAGAKPDLCGLMMINLMWNGGYTYLHQDVPFLWGMNPDDQRRANYLLGPANVRPPAGYLHVGGEGNTVLLRRDGPCEPMPDRSTDMPGP